MPKTYYSLTSSDFSFIAVVTKSKNELHIHIGNPFQYKSACVHLEVIGLDTLYIHNLAHDPSCSTNKTLPKGENGTVIMLKASIEFACMLFPGVQKVRLQDNSGFYKAPFKHTVLSTRDYLLYGKTWYQRHLCLKPVDVEDQKLVKKYDRILNPARYAQYRELMQHDEVYKSSSSWHEYFSKNGSYTDHMVPMLRKVFKLPDLNGIVWEGEPRRDGLATTFTTIPKPKDMRVFWGGFQKDAFASPYDSMGDY